VCSLSAIDEEIKGSKAVVKVINGKKQIRNNIGLHEKHSLITSRTFRRSFATNYFGKIDTSLIMVITGHSTEKQLRAYISNHEETNIKSTKEQIDKFHEKREYEKQQAKENPTMLVIKNASN
jgi:integrase